MVKMFKVNETKLCQPIYFNKCKQLCAFKFFCRKSLGFLTAK